MPTLHLDLGSRSYPICIGPGLLGRRDAIAPYVAGQQVMVVTNETVAPLFLDKLLAGLTDFQCDSVVLPDGEHFKTLETLNTIFTALLSKHHSRSTTLVALGGGVIGDLTGFAAASYQRGVNFIQVPTTLLAQVDSSVGGKTGVNHPLGKNMIGAFYQPRLVLADTSTLDTLPERELGAGIAEVIKYGLIRDAEFFVWLEDNIDNLRAHDPAALACAIERSCRNKAEVVARDERESGERALLNFGHTFAHAIETGLGYGVWLHGEAVAAGMALAADLSRRQGWLTASDQQRITNLLARAQLPTQAAAALTSERLLELMAVDKKVSGGKLHLILLKAIGRAVICADFDPQLLRATLDTCRTEHPLAAAT